MSTPHPDEIAATGARSVIAGIRAALPGLRRSERKVAECVLADPGAVPEAPIAALAARAGVSEPTVVRFCRALGHSGFQQFRLALARDAAGGDACMISGIERDDDIASLTAKVMDRSVATLLQARRSLDTARIEAAVALLAGASRIELYGQGASGVVAADAQHKLFRLGIPVVAYTDPHVHGMAAAIVPADAVVVAISHTGRSRDIVESVARARGNGAAVIGVTAADSPLAAQCSVVLGAEADEDTDLYTPMMSRLVHLAILDVLAAGLAVAGGDEALERLRRTKRSLTAARGGSDRDTAAADTGQ
ncbi:SIS domain-containing protein [Arhodomonas aquaeolei]|uniref:SIS domain-containing protein n=1 Tax=Arhodomonas aquaeolei TaxID=2369 RepID=UPI00035F9449|nr:SIS domain-containing protein [Arhodomonas aquaeolei]